MFSKFSTRKKLSRLKRADGLPQLLDVSREKGRELRQGLDRSFHSLFRLPVGGRLISW